MNLAFSRLDSLTFLYQKISFIENDIVIEALVCLINTGMLNNSVNFEKSGSVDVYAFIK